MKGSEILKDKYSDLSSSKSVERAVKGARAKGERVEDKGGKRIDVYLKKLDRLIFDTEGKQKKKQMGGGETRPRAVALLREMVMNKYVRSQAELVAKNAAIVEGRAAQDLGHGEVRYEERQLQQRGEIAVEDLEKSLDQWISYLTDQNEPYPIWFRYYAFRSILDLGEYDKDKEEFPTRSEGTIRLFPDIDRGALAYIEDMIEASKDDAILERLKKAQREAQTPAEQIITEAKAVSFAKLPFAKQYVEAMKQAGEITPELRAETKGEWRRFQKGTDPTALWASLQNKGTAWCTKGFATAKTQLEGGDFYVYYTLDAQGKPAIPRIAIRMEGDIISSDVRGVADTQQNIEGNMVEIAEEKMKTLPGHERFKKASADMKQLTSIYKKCIKENKKTGEKTYLNPQLTKDDLIFLYEIEKPIQGFGYQKDPRTEELRSQRDPQKDAPIVFECSPEQIAFKVADISENTKAFIGKLETGIFDKLPKTLEHIYTKFPEGGIVQKEVKIGGKSEKELEKEILAGGNKFYGDALPMMKLMGASEEFKKSEKNQGKEIELIILSVEDMGFPNGATTREIYAKIEELGLEKVPAEVGPQLRIQYADQPMNEYLRIGMEPVALASGPPLVFRVFHDRDGRYLDDINANPDRHWDSDYRWVFRRK